LEVCDERVGAEGSIYLAHEVSVSGAEGKPEDLEKLAKVMHDLSDMYLNGIAARLKISFEELQKRVAGKDYWFGAREALAIGAIDRVVSREEALAIGK